MPFYFDMPLEELQESVQNNPLELDLWLALIKRVAKEDCCESALEEIFVAEDLFPENVELQAIKSLCLMSLGETREAHDLLQQSLRRCPGDEIIVRVLDEFLPNFEGVSQDLLLNPFAIRENIESKTIEREFADQLSSTIDLIHAFQENQDSPENLIGPLEQHIQRFANDINSKLDLARLCHNTGYHNKSRHYYQVVIEEDPLCASAYFELATIEPDLHEAIRLSEMGLDLRPTFECGRYNYGTLLVKVGMFSEARNELLRIPADSPYYVAGLEVIANSHSAQGSFANAITTQEKVVTLNPTDTESWNSFGHFFAQLGDYETALQQFDRVIEIDSEHLDGLHNRALMLGRLERHEEAVHVLKYALTIEPDCKTLITNLAVELSRSKRNEEAIELSNRSLKQFPKHARLWMNLGSFHFEEGNLDTAIECSKKALELEPRKGLAWWNIACSYAKKQNLPECLSALHTCFELNPELANRVSSEESLQPYLHDDELQSLLSSIDPSL